MGRLPGKIILQGGDRVPAFFDYTASSVDLPAVLVANGLGVCLMVMLLTGQRRHRPAQLADGRIFAWICRICLLLCLLESGGFLLDGRSFPGARAAALVCNALLFMLGALPAYLWVCCLNSRIRRRWRLLAALPAAGVMALSAANLFVDVFFGITADNVYYRAPLAWLPYVVTLAYLAGGTVLIKLRQRRTGRYVYMPVSAFLLPVYLGVALQLLFYGLSFIWVAAALGLTSLYISLQSELTFRDPLPNLYNRSFLLHYLSSQKKKLPLAGILLDVNSFKAINDTLGHQEGDRILQAVARMLQEAATDKTVAAVRYGGDEFVVLLMDDDPGQTQLFCQRLDRCLEQYNQTAGAANPISLAAGMARIELGTGDTELFFQEMDRKMYEDKAAFYLRTQTDPARAGERH